MRESQTQKRVWLVEQTLFCERVADTKESLARRAGVCRSLPLSLCHCLCLCVARLPPYPVSLPLSATLPCVSASVCHPALYLCLCLPPCPVSLPCLPPAPVSCVSSRSRPPQPPPSLSASDLSRTAIHTDTRTRTRARARTQGRLSVEWGNKVGLFRTDL